jgi:hypothetical protein
VKHHNSVQDLNKSGFLKLLPLEDNIEELWPGVLWKICSLGKSRWCEALKAIGKRNANPPLPVEGILLTMRLGSESEEMERIASVEELLEQLEEDSLCRYIFILALDVDEVNGASASRMVSNLQARTKRNDSQLLSFQVITNPPRPPWQTFPICEVWDRMAVAAWGAGADWVTLLGGIAIHCRHHYRAIYRSFLDISERLNVPFGFGCPWWNDLEFPGFPSFPCVGKTHFKIVGSLIPGHRRLNFVNQDLAWIVGIECAVQGPQETGGRIIGIVSPVGQNCDAFFNA